MKTEKRRKKHNKGFLLPLAAVAAVLVSFIGLGLLQTGLSARVQAAKTTAEIEARAAADAGFTKALYEMNRTVVVGGGGWSTQALFDNLSSNEDLDITNGNNGQVVSDRVTLPKSNADYSFRIQEVVKDSLYTVTSTGECRSMQKTVSMTVRRQGIFDYGIYSCGYAKPKHHKSEMWPGRKKPPKKGGHLKVKGYNLDTYSSDAGISPSGELVLRTNSKHKKAVKLEKGSIIEGDIVVGPGGKPEKVIEKKDGADVTGNTYVSPGMPELPAVVVPDNLNEKMGEKFDIKAAKKAQQDKDKDKDKDKPLKLSGNLRFQEFKIDEEEAVEVQGNCTMYVEDEMKIEHGGQLIITENSSLTLYVGKKLEIKSDKDRPGVINETKDPTKFIVYGTDTCEKVKFERVGDFYGAVYAPFAKVEMKKNEDVYGALVGWEVKLEKDKDDDNHDFYFDKALGSGDGTARYVEVVWSEQ